MPLLKRSAIGTRVRPANTSAIVSAPARSVLTQNTRFSRRIGATWLRRLRQTSNVAGWSDTEHTAVAVKPAVPGRPGGRHHMHGRAELAHRLAELRGLDGRDVLRGVGLEGAHHRVVGTLVEPAHAAS